MVTPEETVVDRLYQDFQALIASIDPSDLSLQTTVRVNFSKALLLAAASYFEERVKRQIIDFVRERSSNDELVVEFLQNKAIDRQYHTFFDWSLENKNANRFFALFGANFRGAMRDHVRSNSEYDAAVQAFLTIGRERNELVHENFGQFPLEKTIDSIYDTYKSALPFVNSIGSFLSEFNAGNDIDAGRPI